MTFDWKKLNVQADDLLEECARRRLGLKATLDRFLPGACKALGAGAAQIRTTNEALVEESFSWGYGPFPADSSRGVKKEGGRVWVRQPLSVSGHRVGFAAFAFEPGAGSDAELLRAVQTVCEQLDGVLWAIRTSAIKQGLVERMGRSLTRHVFDEAIDDAVAAIREAVPFRRFALVYLDDDDAGTPLYRVYEGARGLRHSKGRRHRGLDALIAEQGQALVEPGRGSIAQALGAPAAASCSLIAGVARPRAIGEAVIDCPTSLDTFGRDLLQIFANAVSQRLVDYNRERRHLAQFFAPGVIDELVRQRDYSRHLSPRVAKIGLLYADINSFTKLCEKALRRPDRIGAFVDLWSTEAVKIVWKHGGIFDKMVGDCVIGHFGPPFHRQSDGQLASSALKAAFEIQRFTAALGRKPEFRGLAKAAGLPGLGVAIGVNLCSAAVGLFGPNKDFTAFSRGMNETARLQSHAGFREVLAMESVRRALAGSRGGTAFSGPHEVQVKNVGRALRYYKATPA